MKNADDIVHATGAQRVASISDLEPETLGSAEYIGVEKFGNDYVFSIEGGTDGEMATLYVRGSSEYVVEEMERAIDGAFEFVAEADTGGVVPGAGSTEMAIASELRDHAVGIRNSKQLAFEAFAEAVEVLPRALAANAGLEPLDTMVELRATFEAEGRGVIVDDGTSASVGDPIEAEVFEPATVKRKTIESAKEAATIIYSY
jgi:chaperonin GroEL (HSP60 family)